MRFKLISRSKVIFVLIILLIMSVVMISLKNHFTDEFPNIEAAAFNTNGLNLVIDAGHGGADGGAVSESNNVESKINLDIALKLEQIMGLYGTSPIMTRSTEDIAYGDEAGTIKSKKSFDTKKRTELINSIENAAVISIHQNKFSSPEPFGAQVLFAGTNGSLDFAETLQELLISKINPENYRTAEQISSDIYLMNNINCPAVLVECGFLSNPEEDRLLATDNYRLKLATVIASGYFTCENDLIRNYIGGTNES